MENSEQIKEWAKGYAKKLSEETTANEEKHLNHPFYAEANQYRETVRREQVLKGAHKYPEPFTTASWTNQEIIDHAMQENVDQAHYIYAAKERMEQLQSEMEVYKDIADRNYKAYERKTKEVEEWKHQAMLIVDVKKDLERENQRANENYMVLLEVEKDRDEWKKRYLKVHAEIQDLQYKLKVAEKERDEFKRAWGCSSEAKSHDCSKNQAIHWQGKDIVKVKCQICDKTLYQA